MYRLLGIVAVMVVGGIATGLLFVAAGEWWDHHKHGPDA
jgi:hypothetical protein